MGQELLWGENNFFHLCQNAFGLNQRTCDPVEPGAEGTAADDIGGFGFGVDPKSDAAGNADTGNADPDAESGLGVELELVVDVFKLPKTSFRSE